LEECPMPADAILCPHVPTPSRKTPSSATVVNSGENWHEGFMQLLPSIRRHAYLRCRRMPPAAKEEAIQDIVCHAMVAYRRLVERGKQGVAFAAPLGRFAVALHRRGSRVGTPENVSDIYSARCQQRHNFAVERLDQIGCNSGGWQEIVVEDRHCRPVDVAAIRIDFRVWLQSLPRRNRHIAERLATGECTHRVARLYRLSPGRVSQLRRELYNSWQLFQGESSTL